MKKFSNWIFLTTAIGALLFLNACYRHDSLSSVVTFEGAVFQGVYDSNTQQVKYSGPLAGVKVFCEKYEGYALTDSAGRYTLKVSPAMRRFEGPDYDIYTLWTEDGSGGDEKITIKAKAGQTIQVKPFLIYSHSYQQ